MPSLVSWRLRRPGSGSCRPSNAARRTEMLGITEVVVTITHTDTDALVMAVAVGEH